MDNNVLIVLIAVVGIVVVVWLLRSRLTSFRVGGSIDKREGEVKLEAAPPQAKDASAPDQKYSVDISGNTSAGDSEIRVSRPDVRVKDNKSLGKSRIEVIDSEKKHRR